MHATDYIVRIRKPVKRDYALKYYAYLINGGTEPERPANLSSMGAQAVRIEIHDLMRRAS